jgi:hypothetical protein
MNEQEYIEVLNFLNNTANQLAMIDRRYSELATQAQDILAAKIHLANVRDKLIFNRRKEQEQ